MCGSTAAQDELQQQQIDFYQQAQAMTAEQYANYKAITAPMQTQFQSIFAKGPNQEGFSSEEKQGLEANVAESTAQNYSNAARAVNEQLAARGGGVNPLTSGPEAQLRQETALSAAREQSREESQIDQADYAQGHSDWKAAAGGLTDIATGTNPVSYENAATSAGSSAEKTASDIASEQNSWVNAAIGAAGSIASNSKWIAG